MYQSPVLDANMQSGPASLGIGLGVTFDPSGAATPVVNAYFTLPTGTSAGAYGFSSAADAAEILLWAQTIDATLKSLKLISET